MRFFSALFATLFIGMSQAEAVVNINTADASALTQFNGVGPATAQKIIDYRTAVTLRLVTHSECKRRGPATLEKIKPDCIVADGETPTAAAPTGN